MEKYKGDVTPDQEPLDPELSEKLDRQWNEFIAECLKIINKQRNEL